ncbi:MAG: IPT/TIG domain-containing protein, partial [Longimicrobiales bacterium]|nr:IPT/TIG domain-containing protein [Longimicrobiales bacterium]
ESSPQTIFFSNLSSSPVTLEGLDAYGLASGDFEVLFPAGLPAVVAPGQSASAEVTFRPQDRGERTGRVRSRQARQGTAPPLIDLLGTSIGPTGAEILMDTTATGWVSPSRARWSAEYGVSNGSAVHFDFEVEGTSDDGLFQSVRFGPSFAYAFEVPNGAYEVTVRALEPEKTAAGERVMDVLVEGQPLLDDLDLFAAVGRRAAYVSPPLPVTVTDGVLDVQFDGVVAQALVSALEVRSIPVLSSPTTSLQFGTVDQGSRVTLDAVFQNDGLHSATIDRLTFRIGAKGDAADFSVDWNGETFAGDSQSVVRFPSIVLSPGTTTVPVTFAPTVHEDHEITLEFESTEAGDRFDITSQGTGGAQAGWGFLHPVPDYDPRFVVDYDQDGVEVVNLLGSESHTHEPGRSLISFEWAVEGATVATTVDTSQVLGLGESLVALTIGDDGAPQSLATDTRSITVHPVDRVPGVLVSYYDGSVAGEVSLLDAVPANAAFVERSAQLSVQPGEGSIGSSPFSEHVMLTMVGQFELLAARTLELVPSGGAGHRLFLDGQAVSGSQALSAGVHTVEARFAVTSVADLPVTVNLVENGAPALDVESSIVHDERAVNPVIHSMPTIGTDLGGNRIVIEGFGFFPESGTIVHWGSTDITSAQFDEWRGEAITLTTPPGVGTVQVTVETPNGISEPVDFSYSPSGPIPIRFDLLSDREVSLPSV